MQAPGKLDLELYAGATFNYELTYIAGGVPVDVTDFDARMQVRGTFTSPAPVFDLTVGSGITLGGTAGTISLTIPAEDSTALDIRTETPFVYDLELEDAEGTVLRLVEGKFTVYPEVTR
jgi:hypothetical protein